MQQQERRNDWDEDTANSAVLTQCTRRQLWRGRSLRSKGRCWYLVEFATINNVSGGSAQSVAVAATATAGAGGKRHMPSMTAPSPAQLALSALRTYITPP